MKWPVKWKRRTADNARDDLADQAERWWSTFVVDPDRLAGWLIDGTPSPHAEHRPGAPT